MKPCQCKSLKREQRHAIFIECPNVRHKSHKDVPHSSRYKPRFFLIYF